MKKLLALLLCLLPVCGLLTGCGGPNIPPENFPHSKTLRLDATVAQVIESENLKESEYRKNFYVGVPVTLDGTKVTAGFIGHPEIDQMEVSYLFPSIDDDALEREYEHFLKYFSTLYGEGRDGTTGPLHFAEEYTVKLHEWSYTLDGEDYLVILAWQISPSFLGKFIFLYILPMSFYNS